MNARYRNLSLLGGAVFNRRLLRLKCGGLLAVAAVAGAMTASAADLKYLKQGDDWTDATRADFYTRDQGSQLIKYAWLKALKYPDGSSLLGDQLSRYGYLPKPASSDGLPVGFTKAGEYAGMNCAACHTRQIQVNGQEYRVDGGPALVDGQSMFVALDKAVADVLSSDAKFLAFANEVQPHGDADDLAQLKDEVKAWFLRYDTLISRGMPPQAWGPGRLDAVGMIFNRLTGLDIGPPPSFLIPENIKSADAPVRYPFLWNAAIQDFTQWPGFAENGNDLLALSRNLGEVYGVFATFEPKKAPLHPLGIDYLSSNSANFDGLGKLEDLIKKIGPPQFPSTTDKDLAAKGKEIYERKGSCADCHGIKPGKERFFNKTWATPIMDVGTDSREYNVITWTSKTGVLEGHQIPFDSTSQKLKPVDQAFSVLSLAVKGAIIQKSVPAVETAANDLGNLVDKINSQVDPDAKTKIDAAVDKAKGKLKLPSKLKGLKTVLSKAVDIAQKGKAPPAPTPAPAPAPAPGDGPFKYESRVMQGVWAAAPYLHNGSVPTLAALLEPVANRPKSFKIGPNYDIDKLGMAEVQTKFGDQTLVTSTDRNSGSYNGGHEFGTDLSPDDKKALLEYLKTL